MVHFPLSQQAPSRRHAFTFVEALIVIGVMGLLITVVLPNFFPRHRTGNGRINCLNNLKQVTLAYRIWADDHQGQLPWQVPISEGGTIPEGGKPSVDFGNFASAFQCISNELTVPKVLICPNENVKNKAMSFAPAPQNQFGGTNPANPTAENVSYMLGWEAAETKPNVILSGDPNLLGTGVGQGTVNQAEILSLGARLNGLGAVQLTNQVQWGKDYHQEKGNLALSDGSAHQVSPTQLAGFFEGAIRDLPDRDTPPKARPLSVRILRGF